MFLKINTLIILFCSLIFTINCAYSSTNPFSPSKRKVDIHSMMDFAIIGPISDRIDNEKHDRSYKIESYDQYQDMIEEINYPNFFNFNSKLKKLKYFNQEAVREFFLQGGETLYLFPVKSLTFSEYKKGIKVSEKFEEISVLATPGLVAVDRKLSLRVYRALESQSRYFENRFIVIDGPLTQNINDIVGFRNYFSTSSMAIYASWAMDQNDDDIYLPPSVFILGAYVHIVKKDGALGRLTNHKINAQNQFSTWTKQKENILYDNGVNIFKSRNNDLIILGDKTTSRVNSKASRFIPMVRYLKHLKYSLANSNVENIDYAKKIEIL